MRSKLTGLDTKCLAIADQDAIVSITQTQSRNGSVQYWSEQLICRELSLQQHGEKEGGILAGMGRSIGEDSQVEDELNREVLTEGREPQLGLSASKSISFQHVRSRRVVFNTPKCLPISRMLPGNHLPIRTQHRGTCLLCSWARQQVTEVGEKLARFTEVSFPGSTKFNTNTIRSDSTLRVEGRGNYKRFHPPGGVGKRAARSWISCSTCSVFLCQPVCFMIWHTWRSS